MFTVTLWTDSAGGGGSSSPSRKSPDLGIVVPNGWVFDKLTGDYQEAIIGEPDTSSRKRIAVTGVDFVDIMELDEHSEDFVYDGEKKTTYFFGDYLTFGPTTDDTEREFDYLYAFADPAPTDVGKLKAHFDTDMLPTIKQQAVFKSVLAERVIRAITGAQESTENTKMTEAIRRLRGNEAGLLLGDEQGRSQASAEQVIQGLLDSMNHTATFMARQNDYNTPYNAKIEAEYPPKPCDAILGATIAPTRYLQFEYRPDSGGGVPKTSKLQLDKHFYLFMLSKPLAANAGDISVAARTADLKLPEFDQYQYVNELAESDGPARLREQRVTIRTEGGKQETITPLKKTEYQVIRPSADYLIFSSEDTNNAGVSIEIEESIVVYNSGEVSVMFEFHAASVYSGSGGAGHYVGVAAAGRGVDGSPMYKWCVWQREEGGGRLCF